MTKVSAAITHARVSGLATDGNPSLLQGPDWDADHKIDPVALAAAMNLQIVEADPNGVRAGAGLALDIVNNQVWLNTGGTTWTALVRADGGAAPQRTAIAWLGNSQYTSQGVNTDNMSRAPNVGVPDERAVLDKIYAQSSNEPIPLVDIGRGILRCSNIGAAPGFGPELGFGRELFDLLNGHGAAVTESNRPWLISFAISGMALWQMLPSSTYGQATPAFAGSNAYGAWRARVNAALAASGRRLGLLVSDLGPNDGAVLDDANAVAANWLAMWAQVSADFPGVQLMLMLMHPNTDAAFRPATVRAQQLLAASQIPGCRVVDYGDLPLNGDNLHLGSRRIWQLGLKAAAAARDQLGLLPRKSSTVDVRGYGEPEYSDTVIGALTLKPGAYPLTQDGDVQLLVVGSLKLSGGYTTIPAPTVPGTGWTQLGNATQAGGGFSGETQGFALFMRPTAQTDIDNNPNGKIPPGAQILLSNSENYAKLFTLFGPSRFPQLDGAVQTFAATSFSNGAFAVPSVVTTTRPRSLVVIAFVTQGGGVSPFEAFSISNPNLSNLRIVSDEPYGLATGNFGVLVFAVGTKEDAGPIGITTITQNNPSFNFAVCGFAAAFKDA